jgi:citronellol/citronellal dehydrogenase
MYLTIWGQLVSFLPFGKGKLMTTERTLRGKTLFITGASRGIGKAIALRAAQDGANIIIAAKTTTAHVKLPGTIHSAAEEIEAAGGKALAVKTDIRFEDQVDAAINTAVEHFGGLDIVVNNASAISLTGILQTPMKTYDRMFDINARGSYLVTQKALPYLLEAENPHVLNLSPPLNLDPKWFEGHAAYTLAKYAMSVWVLGMSREFAECSVAFNALWPCTAIATAAVRNLLGGEKVINASRKPEIMGEAAWYVLTRPSRQCTGNFFTDEAVLAEEGETNLDQYAVQPGTPLFTDFFLD